MTRIRRYLISAAVLAACACFALGMLAMLPPRQSVTKANFDRIHDEMSFDEVAAILGNESMPLLDEYGPRFTRQKWFNADGSSVRVLFKDGKVRGTIWIESTETVPDKLRRWLGLAK